MAGNIESSHVSPSMACECLETSSGFYQTTGLTSQTALALALAVAPVADLQQPAAAGKTEKTARAHCSIRAKELPDQTLLNCRCGLIAMLLQNGEQQARFVGQERTGALPAAGGPGRQAEWKRFL